MNHADMTLDHEKRLRYLESLERSSPNVWDDLLQNSVTVGGGASAPTFSAYNGNLLAYEFLGTGVTTKDLQMAWQMPHAWKEGSDIEPHIHLYVPNDGTGGVIKFYFEYTWTNVDAEEVAATTISGTYTVTAAAGNRHRILQATSIVGTGKTLSSIVSARIYRNPADAADTFAASVWLKAADIHYLKDSHGSRQEYVK